MFVNEVFKDIRLVGAPPSNIGKFGGDSRCESFGATRGDDGRMGYRKDCTKMEGIWVECPYLRWPFKRRVARNFTKNSGLLEANRNSSKDS
jgi:hypothetical protein